MRRLPWPGLVLAGALFGVLLITGAATVSPASAQEGSSQVAASDVVVSVSVSEVSALTGDTFTFTSEITNRGSVVTPPLIANLNFVSLDQSTYVDPEDWSPDRTLTVAPIDPGSSATLSWSVTSVLKGDIATYVVLLPNASGLAPASPLIASPAIRVHVGEQRTLNPGGVLPVVIAVPGVLAVAFAGLRVTGERRRS